jgi:HEAT repeat protein
LVAGVSLALLTWGSSGCQRERLIKELEAGGRPEPRAQALARLGELSNEDDFSLFLKGARDSSALVRRAAAEALGKSGNTKAVDPLGELLADADDDVQAEAAAALARFNNEKSRAYLLSAYGRQDAPARIAIARALGPTGLAEAIRLEAKMLWDRNLKALESGGPAERVGAAEELGRSGRSEAIERLLPMLGDDSLLLAGGAARGLGAARDLRALPWLVGVLKENYPVLREAAAEALGNLGEPSAIIALENMALEGGPGAIAATRAIGQLGALPEARQSLCKLAAQGGREVAHLSARLARTRGESCPLDPIVSRLSKGSAETLAGLDALAALESAKGAEKVAALIDGPNREMRLAALRTLSEIQVASPPDKLVKMLEAERDRIAVACRKWVSAPLPLKSGAGPGEGEASSQPSAQNGAPPQIDRERDRAAKLNEMMAKVEARNEARAESLGLRLAPRDPHSLDLVPDIPEGEDDLLLALIRASGRLRAPGAEAILLELATSSRARTRAAACEGLGSIAGPGALGAAAKCLEDPDQGVVEAAARGLSHSGSEAVRFLMARLAKGSDAGRAEIVRSLGALKAKESARAIAGMLGARGPECEEALEALKRLGDPSVVPALAEQLREHKAPGRLGLIEALGALADPKAVAVLGEELFNDRPEVRAAAARALGRCGQRDPFGALEALRFDYYAEVRRAAEESLGKTARGAPGVH